MKAVPISTITADLHLHKAAVKCAGLKWLKPATVARRYGISYGLLYRCLLSVDYHHPDWEFTQSHQADPGVRRWGTQMRSKLDP